MPHPWPFPQDPGRGHVKLWLRKKKFEEKIEECWMSVKPPDEGITVTGNEIGIYGWGESGKWKAMMRKCLPKLDEESDADEVAKHLAEEVQVWQQNHSEGFPQTDPLGEFVQAMDQWLTDKASEHNERFWVWKSQVMEDAPLPMARPGRHTIC